MSRSACKVKTPTKTEVENLADWTSLMWLQWKKLIKKARETSGIDSAHKELGSCYLVPTSKKLSRLKNQLFPDSAERGGPRELLPSTLEMDTQRDQTHWGRLPAKALQQPDRAGTRQLLAGGSVYTTRRVTTPGAPCHGELSWYWEINIQDSTIFP